jgi:4a-hydroxytetrahydrobiopterin dehydratase
VIGKSGLIFKCFLRGGDKMKLLAKSEIEKRVKSLSGWQCTEAGTTLEKNFTFSNFTDAVCFLNRIAEFAEEENHHPDLHLTDYKRLKVVLSTHSAGGLTQKDFVLAEKIEAAQNGA